MQAILATEPYKLLSPPASTVEVKCEPSLRSAAATVAQPWPDHVDATHCGPARIVGALGCDPPSAVDALVRELAREFELDASVRFESGAFFVRFASQNCPALTTSRAHP